MSPKRVAAARVAVSERAAAAPRGLRCATGSRADRTASAATAMHTVLAAVWLIAGCAGDRVAPNPPAPEPSAQASRSEPVEPADRPAPLLVGNQLRNPGFEHGADGWGELDGQRFSMFTVVDSPIHSGSRSARLALSWEPGDREARLRVQSAAQEISPPRFPTRLGGWYWVESWENASTQTDMYLSAVVIVWGDPRTRAILKPESPRSVVYKNYQVRYYLGGVSEPPFLLTNGRMKAVVSGPPAMRQWVHFEMPVAADFEALWGTVPANYEYLRVFFEVRWDNKEPGAGLAAEVYYDDLEFGFDPWP